VREEDPGGGGGGGQIYLADCGHVCGSGSALLEAGSGSTIEVKNLGGSF
jgi:hypothetical protein